MEIFRVNFHLLLVASIVLALVIAEDDDDSGSNSEYSYDEEYLEVQLDHFSFARRERFKLKYLVNDTFWDKENKGPILFYTGNEGSVESFADNSGFIWELAPQFKAAVIFAEHRFYGESSPPDSLKEKLEGMSTKIMGYLTVEQTLADYAKLISYFKYHQNASDSPVIAFGGSYGGILSAWLRLKYPHVVIGAISSSAPFLMQSVPCETFDVSLAEIFGNTSQNCVQTIKKSWSVINSLGKTRKGRQHLARKWRLCTPLSSSDDVKLLKNWLESMYGFLAMANYPYPANFLQDLPGNPVEAFCAQLNNTNKNDQDAVVEDMFKAINVYINNTGNASCFDYSDESSYSTGYSSSDDYAFNFQSCTELINPDCDYGQDDFFEPSPWDFEDFSNSCFETYHVRPILNRTDVLFGGRDFTGASNILFSNGLLDPWYHYGILGNLSDSLISISIPGAAHHLDLRASHPNDSHYVQEARNFEKTQITKWIEEYASHMTKLREIYGSN